MMNRTETDRDRIDVLDLIAALLAGRRLVISGTIAVCIAAAGLSFTLDEQYEAVVQLLIAAGAPVGAANGVNGWTALHNASWNQQTSTAKLLVETFHADASATTTADHTVGGRTFPAGSTAADVAEAQGHVDVVACFLAMSAQ